MADFDYDVFISYSHIDNATPSKDQEGWIATLHRALELRLAQLLGEHPRIWRDLKLQGNDLFNDEIVEQLHKAATLVAVLSPRYVRSEWCNKELSAFHQAAERSPGEAIPNKSRVFKVVKTPIAVEQPPPTDGLLGYNFFEVDARGRPREYVQGFGTEPEKEFWAQLDDLAYDLCQLLTELKSGPSAESTILSPGETGQTIYLAETTSDLAACRDQIRRELLSHGHVVLPDQPLPLRGGKLESLIEDSLRGASLSIHLVGATYDIVPEGCDESLIELQAALASKRGREDSFSRLIWMPADLEVEDQRQQKVIEALRTDPSLQPTDGVLETTLEELKSEIHDRLRPAPQAAEEAAGSAAGQPARVYLMFDQGDVDAVAPLEDYLWEQGLDVVVPLFDGDEGAVNEEHWDNLHRADAVLLYQGTAGEAWLRTRLRDLRKAPAGREGPLRTRAIYVAGPQTPPKDRYRSREVDEVIKRYDDFAPDALAGFLDRLGGARGSVS